MARVILSKDKKKLGIDAYEHKGVLGELGARYSAPHKLWVMPATPSALAQVMAAIPDIEVSRDLLPLVGAADGIEQAQSVKSDGDLDDVPCSKTQAWGHQRKAYHFAKTLWSQPDPPGVLHYLGMGCGKSKIAVDLIINTEDARRVLIVCPKSVIDVWPKQFSIHAGHDQYDMWHSKKGTLKRRASEVKDFFRACEAKGVVAVVVINYEAMWREPMYNTLAKAGLDMCILDESQKAKGHNSKVSRALGKMAPFIKYRLCLTGTPMPNGPLDLFGQFRFLDKGVFGTSFTRFRNQYAVMGGPEGNWVLGSKNEKDLQAKMFRLTYKADRDVLDLPEAVHMEVPVELTPKAMKLYGELEKEFYAEVDEGEITITNALTKLLRLQQLTGGWLPTDDGTDIRVDTGKEDALRDIIEGLGTEPVIVFCKFRHDLDCVKSVCKKLSTKDHAVRYSELSGRENTLKEWQDGHTQVIGVQIQAGGVGIDLTRACKCVYYSVGYSLGDYEQSLARCHRPGQKDNVTYIHLKATGTVDEKVYKALANKQKVIESIVEGGI